MGITGGKIMNVKEMKCWSGLPMSQSSIRPQLGVTNE